MYKVIVEKELEKLEKIVSKLVTVGWKPTGGVLVSTARSKEVEYFQAIYKEKTKPHEDKKEVFQETTSEIFFSKFFKNN